MADWFEAVAFTTGGTYRAAAVSQSAIAVTEDGVDGVLDYIAFVENQIGAGSPEHLTVLLKWWIFEHVRGVNILSASLVRRT